MDIVSWALINNDPMAAERVSLIQFFIVFFGIFISIWYTSLLLAKRVLANPDGTAWRMGFRDYQDMHFQITRVSFGIACCFLAAVCLVFFFTQYVDIMDAMTKVYHEFYWEECEKMGGAVQCFKFNNGQLESVVNRTLINWSSWSPESIQHKANASENADK
jgi:hypothetical protein